MRLDPNHSVRQQLLVLAAAVLFSLLTLAVRGWPPQVSLYGATVAGDVVQVRRNLDWGMPVDDFLGPWDGTPLYWACHRNRDDVAALLIERHANPNATTQDGERPLHRVDNVETARRLLAVGAKAKVATVAGSTPLHAAAERGNPDLVDLLVASGINVNVREGKDYTPLHLAAMNGHDKAVRRLIDLGANVHLRDVEGSTPLHVAVLWGHTAVAEALLASGASLTVQGRWGWTPLHCVRDPATVRALLAAGADVGLRDDGGRTPLHSTVLQDHLAAAEELIAGGASVSAVDSEGATPLHCATSSKMVNLLAERGADLEARDNNGRTPLHWAAHEGLVESVKALLILGARAAATDNDGKTPLQVVGELHKADVAECFAKHGIAQP